MAFSSTPIAHAKVHHGTTGAIDTTGANLIVIYTTDILVDYSTPSDSKSNTWIGLTGQTDGVAFEKIWYAYNPTVGSGHTFTCANGGFNTEGLTVTAWSGSDSSPADQQNGRNDANPFPGTTKQPGSVTPTTNDQLIIQGVGYRFTAAAPMSINDSYTISDDESTGNHCLAMAYLVQTSAGATNPTWTFSTSDSGYGGMVVATFKAAGGGGAVGWAHLLGDSRSRLVVGGG